MSAHDPNIHNDIVTVPIKDNALSISFPILLHTSYHSTSLPRLYTASLNQTHNMEKDKRREGLNKYKERNKGGRKRSNSIALTQVRERERERERLIRDRIINRQMETESPLCLSLSLCFYFFSIILTSTKHKAPVHTQTQM